MRRLLQPKNIMVSAHARTKEYDKSKYISILNIIQVQFSLPLLWNRHESRAPSMQSLGVAFQMAKLVNVVMYSVLHALLFVKLCS